MGRNEGNGIKDLPIRRPGVTLEGCLFLPNGI